MNKGFTLIELLGVIVLLGILSAIAVPAVENALKSGGNKLTAAQQNQIKKGAKEFFSENIYCLPGNDHSKCNFSITCITFEGDNSKSKITLSCLKQEGYLPSSIKNLSNDEDYADSTRVVVTKNGSNFDYSIE